MPHAARRNDRFEPLLPTWNFVRTGVWWPVPSLSPPGDRSQDFQGEATPRRACPAADKATKNGFRVAKWRLEQTRCKQSRNSRTHRRFRRAPGRDPQAHLQLAASCPPLGSDAGAGRQGEITSRQSGHGKDEMRPLQQRCFSAWNGPRCSFVVDSLNSLARPNRVGSVDEKIFDVVEIGSSTGDRGRRCQPAAPQPYHALRIEAGRSHRGPTAAPGLNRSHGTDVERKFWCAHINFMKSLEALNGVIEEKEAGSTPRAHVSMLVCRRSHGRQEDATGCVARHLMGDRPAVGQQATI